MRTYLFDDWRSVLHGVFGILVVFLSLFGLFGKLVGLVGLLGFVWYEVNEPEVAVATVGDVVEFLVGVAVGVLLLW